MPSSGTISPHSEHPMHITFTPDYEGPINCNPIFKVRGKSAPLSLNIKGIGAAIRSRLEVEFGGRIFELSDTATNDMDFGKVHAFLIIMMSLSGRDGKRGGSFLIESEAMLYIRMQLPQACMKIGVRC
jgi:hypothetical protein